MKKIVLTLAALGALSTAAFAERNHDLRDYERFTSSGTPVAVMSYDTANAAGFIADVDGDGAVSNFERLNANSAKNESATH